MGEVSVLVAVYVGQLGRQTHENITLDSPRNHAQD